MIARRVALAVAVALAALLPAACDDKSEDAGKVVATAKPHELPAWLTNKEKIEPAVWLRSREVGHEVLATDPEVDRLRRALQQASSRFYEDQRMIANRTAQIGDMLAEAHQPERYVDVLTGMIDVADASAQKKLYGELVQHYIIVRREGKDRTAAIRQLSDAYGDQGNIHKD